MPIKIEDDPELAEAWKFYQKRIREYSSAEGEAVLANRRLGVAYRKFIHLLEQRSDGFVTNGVTYYYRHDEGLIEGR
jgi:predicted butyrate kinase (DUF1464 family)